MNKQDEILLILQEECAEVIQAISKVKRFGMENNKDQLEQELADCLLMMNLCYENGIVDDNKEKLRQRMEIKKQRLMKYSSIYDTTSN